MMLLCSWCLDNQGDYKGLLSTPLYPGPYGYEVVVS
jgi:hypothetical protein